ncbi:MAG TPA: hypothetical protein VKS60_16365 [Stellaceae bacterium]|nr:hypothetical protein [Stellaceae bacterium]
MPGRFPVAFVILPLLAACATGLPFSHGPDPQAGATLQDTAPLVTECRDRFKAALGSMQLAEDAGPTVESDGDFRRVTLEAGAGDPNVLHPYRYECDFEAGKLTDTNMSH